MTLTRCPTETWVACLSSLRQATPKAQYQRFLAPTEGRRWETEETLVVAAGSDYARSWLERPQHQGMANDALTRVVLQPAEVRYISDDVASAPRLEAAPAAVTAEESITIDDWPKDEGGAYICPRHGALLIACRWPVARYLKVSVYYCPSTSDGVRCSVAISPDPQIGVIRGVLDVRGEIKPLELQQLVLEQRKRNGQGM